MRKIELDVKDTCDNTWECYHFGSDDDRDESYCWEIRFSPGSVGEVIVRYDGVFIRNTFPINLEVIDPILDKAYEVSDILTSKHLEAEK